MICSKIYTQLKPIIKNKKKKYMVKQIKSLLPS